jgi:hypothetical protein
MGGVYFVWFAQLQYGPLAGARAGTMEWEWVRLGVHSIALPICATLAPRIVRCALRVDGATQGASQINPRRVLQLATQLASPSLSFLQACLPLPLLWRSAFLQQLSN